MANGKNTYMVIDKHGNKQYIEADYLKQDDQGFITVVYCDRSGCVDEHKDIKKGVFHEPSSITLKQR